MAFNVYMKTEKVKVDRTDVIFTVREDRSKLGALHISKGAVVWCPRNSKKRGYKVSWRKLAEFMEENGVTRETR